MASQDEAKDVCFDVIKALGDRLSAGNVNIAQVNALSGAMKDVAEAWAWLSAASQPH